MPGATPNRGYPYPLGSDPLNIAGDIQDLAESIDVSVQDVDDRFGADHTYITKSFAAGTATSQAPGVGFITIPTTGVWFMACNVDLVGGAGYGFVDAWWSSMATLDRIGVTIIDLRQFEAPTRVNASGLWIMDFTQAPFDAWLRLNTFTSGIGFNGAQGQAWKLHSP